MALDLQDTLCGPTVSLTITWLMSGHGEQEWLFSRQKT
jgi:hypothetical protein